VGGGSWGSSNTSIAIIDASGLLTSVSPGHVTITYTLPTGCTTTIGITVDSLPSIVTGVDSVCVGDSLIIPFTGSGSWSSSDAAVATVNASSGIFYALSAGTTSLTYTLPSGCSSIVTITVSVCSGSGVIQITNGGSNISVVPNPNKGEFNMSGTLNTVADEEVTLELTDLLGQVVYRGKAIAQNGKLNVSVKLSETLANGMYLLNLRSATDNEVFHVVVEQ